MDPAYEQLANRLARVQRHRRKWARRLGIECYRLYERDIADQPLIVDWYAGEAVVWAFPRTRNSGPAEEQAWLAAVGEAVRQGLGLEPAQVFLKQRRPQAGRQQGGREGAGQYQRLGAQGAQSAVRTVREQGLAFEVNLSDFIDTGLFLDHRWTRAQVRARAQGARVLNLFAYTGSFTCYAAAGGARGTCTVDLSNTYLAWCARNLALNGVGGVGGVGGLPGLVREGGRGGEGGEDGAGGELGRDPAPSTSSALAPHQLERADCLAWLAQPPRGEPFDLIVLDPPTFSNSTAMARDFVIQRDHAWLIGRCRERLRPGGELYFSTNFRGFALDPGLAGWAVEDLSEASIPEDFRDRRIHRLWRLVRSS